MLKQYTFLALALIGCAMLLLERNTNSFAARPQVIQVAFPVACTRTVNGPTVSRASVAATVRAQELKCRIAALHARMRASVARLQAEKACWFSTFNEKLYGKPSAATSPAWRDLHYDAQELAKMLGFCSQEPV